MSDTVANDPTITLEGDPARSNRLGAFGIAVADLDRSAAFYRSLFGMVDAATFELPHMREIVLGFASGKGAGLVLMQYTDGSDNSRRGDPLKVVLYVADPVATASAVVDHGGSIVLPPRAFQRLGGAVVGFAKDLDGHLIELLEA